jgi:hypothetical protein
VATKRAIEVPISPGYDELDNFEDSFEEIQETVAGRHFPEEFVLAEDELEEDEEDEVKPPSRALVKVSTNGKVVVPDAVIGSAADAEKAFDAAINNFVSQAALSKQARTDGFNLLKNDIHQAVDLANRVQARHLEFVYGIGEIASKVERHFGEAYDGKGNKIRASVFIAEALGQSRGWVRAAMRTYFVIANEHNLNELTSMRFNNRTVTITLFKNHILPLVQPEYDRLAEGLEKIHENWITWNADLEKLRREGGKGEAHKKAIALAEKKLSGFQEKYRNATEDAKEQSKLLFNKVREEAMRLLTVAESPYILRGTSLEDDDPAPIASVSSTDERLYKAPSAADHLEIDDDEERSPAPRRPSSPSLSLEESSSGSAGLALLRSVTNKMIKLAEYYNEVYSRLAGTLPNSGTGKDYDELSEFLNECKRANDGADMLFELVSKQQRSFQTPAAARKGRGKGKAEATVKVVAKATPKAPKPAGKVKRK